MDNITKFLIAFLILTNLFVFFIYGWDKLSAKMHQWRVPESVLIVIALPGSAYGALLAMLVFRHKIRKPKFTVTIPLLAVIEGFLLFLIFRSLGAF